MKLSESPHRQNFIDQFRECVQEVAYDSDLSFANATVRVVLDWLGYEAENSFFIDGRDRGVDAWVFPETTDPGLDIFQVKTHRLKPDGSLCLDSFSGSGVQDLERAKNLLLHENPNGVKNTKLQRLLSDWNAVIHDRKQRENEVPMQVTLNLVILGDNLTEQAQQEFSAFSAANAELATLENGVSVQFHPVLYTIDSIIDGKWRETNREWRDLRGKKQEDINLTPLNEDFISDNKNAVFY